MRFVNIGDLKRQLLQKNQMKNLYNVFDYRAKNDFVGMDMCRKFLEMGFT